MRYLHYSEVELSTYPICFLVPSIQRDEIRKTYLDPFSMDPDEVLVMDLHYSRTSKKTPRAEIKDYISTELMPVLSDMGVEYIAVADAEYFKALTKTENVDLNLGYILPCEYGPQQVVYIPSYKMLWRDPVKVGAKISQGLTALTEHRAGLYKAPGNGIIQYEHYPSTLESIKTALAYLLSLDRPLTIDIETFSLKHHTAGIGTISFAWSKHEGIAFAVDLTSEGTQVRNEPVRLLLRWFFESFQQRAMYHNIAFDAYVLIYQLYMRDILDTEGLLRGMSILLRNWDCTKLVAYLATNSCAGNKLSLKDQAQEFAGNYAMGESIKDIRQIPLDKLLRYNLIDCLSTWHVYEKHWDSLVADDQLDIYRDLFKPSTLDIIQMQLTGMPLNMRRTREVRWLLYRDQRTALKKIRASPLVQRFTLTLNQEWVTRRNQELKKKRVSLADAKEIFNPNSDPQLRSLLYEMLGLPQLDFTDSGLPSTGGKTLEKLLNHTSDPEVLDFLRAMMDFAAVDKILSSFIPAMLKAALGPDGWHYLFGNFNLGGTVSGRLSSSDPNLQNLPANSKYAKLIKSCFQAPPGWLFVGLDFASLEDRISALTTKDPNKLKVYTDGYDGHSLRAYAYFGEHMPDIDPLSVASINSIATKYPQYRQDSKAPTFALTYQGTFNTLMVNCGFSLELAKQVEARYHELYKISDDWVAARLSEASRTGYVTAAFGLRVRTPLLKQVIRGNRATPSEAEAEGRTAGNALGQSWCLLNSRACVEFMGLVRAGSYRLDIRPCAQIHDAQYYLMRDDVGTVAYTNRHLVQAVEWQDHPDIAHDEVKLGGEVDLFHPHWGKKLTIPNGATEDDILSLVAEKL